MTNSSASALTPLLGRVPIHGPDPLTAGDADRVMAAEALATTTSRNLGL